MTWAEDPTDQMPQPQVAYHTHHHVERRSDAVWFTAIVFLTFAIGAGISLAATFTLADAVNRALSIPVCREVK